MQGVGKPGAALAAKTVEWSQHAFCASPPRWLAGVKDKNVCFESFDASGGGEKNSVFEINYEKWFKKM